MAVLRMQDQQQLAMVLTCATAVCGASAATATYGCVGGPKEVLTVSIAIVNLFTIPQMLALPFLAKAMGLSARVSGAWFGGAVDATGAVIAAGSVFDDLQGIDCDEEPACALDTASTVKIIQNVIIGPICLAVTAFWLSKVREESQSNAAEPGRASVPTHAAAGGGAAAAAAAAATPLPPAGPGSKARQLWKRFPKFILGFLFVSLIITVVNATASSQVQDTLQAGVSAGSRWWFGLGFAGIGLTTNFRELAQPLRGGKPILLYCLVQLFDLVLTLGAAQLAFGVLA
jgi:uncharacterized membrane protein YadS